MTEISVQQQIAAPPSTVYRYLTESHLWSEWQGSTAQLDARQGGIFSIVMPGGMNARGQFTELVPDVRVVFTWGWVDRPGIPPGSTIVTIDLTPTEDGTLLTLTHTNLPVEESEHHLEGWKTMLPQLATLAAR